MSLKSRMQRDNKRILETDSDPLILYNADGEMQAGYGRYAAPAIHFSPNGQLLIGPKFSIDFHIDSFSLITSANEDYVGWKADLINSEGEIITGTFNGQMRDTTFGYVSTNLQKIRVV